MGMLIAMIPIILIIMVLTVIKLGIGNAIKLWAVWLVVGFASYHWVSFCLETF